MTHSALLTGQINNGRTVCGSRDRCDALLRIGPGGIRLAGGHDLAVAGLEAKSVLAGLVLVDLELPRQGARTVLCVNGARP